MPFRLRIYWLYRSYTIRICTAALLWLILISFMHNSLNREDDGITFKMGYMPVVTNLAAPLLDFASLKEDSNIRYQAIKFSSFSEMAAAFRNDQIHAAFIIAPLAIVLFQQGEDVRIVYIGNRHESTLVVRRELQVKEFKDLTGSIIAVPMRYSGHNLSLQRLIRSNDLENRIQVVEMNPPDMAAALTAGTLDAYFVGEPFAAVTLRNGVSKLLLYAEQVQPNFVCNLLIVKQRLIDKDTEAVRMLVEGAARAGVWAKNNRLETAQICSKYWGQSEDLIEYALSTPPERIVFDRFIPIYSEIKSMAEDMVTFGLIQDADIEDLVDDRFALQADVGTVRQNLSSIIK